MAASMQSARDFIAARIWPLEKGWGFVHFFEKVVKGKTYLFPYNEAFCPKSIPETKILSPLLKLRPLKFLASS